MTTPPATPPSAPGLEFPGVIEVTAMGAAEAGLDVRVPEIVATFGLSVLNGSLRVRPSREGRYHSVSVSFSCPTRALYEAVHAALHAHPDVRWML